MRAKIDNIKGKNKEDKNKEDKKKDYSSTKRGIPLFISFEYTYSISVKSIDNYSKKENIYIKGEIKCVGFGKSNVFFILNFIHQSVSLFLPPLPLPLFFLF